MSKEPKIIRAEEIRELNERRRELNNLTIDEIIITDPDGNKIEFDDEFIKNWTLTGLNTTDLELVIYDEDGKLRNEIGMWVWKKK